MRCLSYFSLLALCLASSRFSAEKPIYPVRDASHFTWDAPAIPVDYERLEASRPIFPLPDTPYDPDLRTALDRHHDVQGGAFLHKRLSEERREKEQRDNFLRAIRDVEERIRRLEQDQAEEPTAVITEVIPEIIETPQTVMVEEMGPEMTIESETHLIEPESPLATETVVEMALVPIELEEDDLIQEILAINYQSPLQTSETAPQTPTRFIADENRLNRLFMEMGRTPEQDLQRTNYSTITQHFHPALRQKKPEPEPAQPDGLQEQERVETRKRASFEEALGQPSMKKFKEAQPSPSSDDNSAFIVPEPKKKKAQARFIGKDRSKITFTSVDEKRIVLFNVFRDTDTNTITKLLESKGLKVDQVLPSTNILKSWNRQNVAEVIMKSEDDAKRAVELLRGAALDKRALGVALAPSSFEFTGLTAVFGILENKNEHVDVTYGKIISVLNPLHSRFNKTKGVVKMLFNSKQEVMEARTKIMKLKNSNIQLYATI